MWTEPPLRAAGLAMMVLCAGCSSDPASVPPTRWIEADPQQIVDRSFFLESETIFEITPSNSDADQWQTWGVRSVEFKGRRAVLTPEGRWAGLSREVDVDASAVAAIEVTASGARQVMVDWAGPDGVFSPQQRVEVKISPHTPATMAPTRLQVADHPLWNGRIRALRVGAVRAASKKTVTFESVRGIAEQVRPERLEELVGQPWKVDVDHEVRNALLGLVGSPVEREVQVPDGGVLRFGFAVEPRQTKAVGFVIAADAGAGSERVIFRKQIEAGGGGAWHDAEVDLSPFSGRLIQLVLRVEADGLDPRLGFPVWSNPEVVAPAGRRPPNLLVISVDTLRADRLSLYGYDRVTSPGVDRWAAESAVVFDNTVVQAPWTLPSHVSLFTGLEPVHHGINFREQASPSFEMLAEYMRRLGHATVAITGGGFVHPSFGFSQGFDSYRYWSARYRSERELEDGVERALNWLDRNGDRPFFMFFHTFEVHGPYRARQPYYDRLQRDGPEPPNGVVRVMDGPVSAADGFRRSHGFFTLESPEGSDERTRLGEEALPMVSLLYDSQVAYMDAQMARLLAAIEACGPTTVVFTSDHGENIGERGDAGHGPLDDANLMVPLIVAFADGRGAGSRVLSQVRSIDIAPTLLDVFGIAPAAAMDGLSLLPAVDDPSVFHSRPAWSYNPAMNLGIAVRLDNRFKYRFNDTAWSPVFGDDAWFDLEADPWESSVDGVPWSGSEDVRQWTAEALAGAVGWRLRISNRGAEVFSARLSSDALQPAKVKRVPGGGGSVDWRGHGRAKVLVEPGRDLTLSLLATESSPVTVASDSSAEGELVPSHGALPVRLALTAEGWLADEDSLRDGEVVVELWRVGQEVAAGQPAEFDPELRERLEALGYLQ